MMADYSAALAIARRSRPSLTLAVFALIGGIGTCAATVAPALIPGLIAGRGLSPSFAGWLQSAELMSAALASLLLGPYLAKRSIHRIALIACLATAALHLLSAFVVNAPALLVLRASAGMAEGVCLCIGNMMVASQRDPDKIYAMVLAITAVVYGPLLKLMSTVWAQGSSVAPFAILAAWVALMAPLLIVKQEDLAVQSVQAQAPKVGAAWNLLPLLGLAAFAILNGGLWSFFGEIAVSIHVSPSQTGTTLWVASVAGVAAALGASILGLRIGRAAALLGGGAVWAVSTFAILGTTSPSTLALGFVLSTASYYFVMPYIFGLFSSLDSSGKLLNAASSVNLIGTAIAPAITGYIAGQGGFHSTTWYPLITYVLMTALFAASLKRAKSGAA